MRRYKTTLGTIEVSSLFSFGEGFVVSRMISGCPVREMAAEMGCSTTNIDKYIKGVKDKLGATNAPMTIAMLFQRELIRFLCLCLLASDFTTPVAGGDDADSLPDRLLLRLRGRAGRSRRHRSQGQSAKNQRSRLELHGDDEMGQLVEVYA